MLIPRKGSGRDRIDFREDFSTVEDLTGYVGESAGVIVGTLRGAGSYDDFQALYGEVQQWVRSARIMLNAWCVSDKDVLGCLDTLEEEMESQKAKRDLAHLCETEGKDK